MFKWLKKLFGSDDNVIEEVEYEKVNLEPVHLEENPTLKAEEACDTRYTEDYANFVKEQYPQDEGDIEKLDRSMPALEEVTVNEEVVEENEVTETNTELEETITTQETIDDTTYLEEEADAEEAEEDIEYIEETQTFEELLDPFADLDAMEDDGE